ncbi:hypothetical protein [Paenibacillus sp. Y412MC10]|nr:hypothetical protein [Paenibacillus sp. Y412MC10]
MLGEFEKEVERSVDFETRDLDDLFRFVRKKCDTETKENESADFVGCFLAGGYSY